MNIKTILCFKSIAVSLICLSVGCAHREGFLGVDCCADIPAGAIPEPAGNKVCSWQTAQVQSALPDQMTLYKSDFVAKTSELSPGAIERIRGLAYSGSIQQAGWIVEPSGDDTLDQNRIQAVVSQLAELGSSDLEVTLAVPAAIGLTGRQAERVAGAVGGGFNRRTNNRRNNNRNFQGNGVGNIGGVF